jgi:hypothetical protein
MGVKFGLSLYGMYMKIQGAWKQRAEKICFICGLFNDAISSSDKTASNDIVSWHSHGGTEDKHENPIKIVGDQVEILTRDLRNTKMQC